MKILLYFLAGVGLVGVWFWWKNRPAYQTLLTEKQKNEQNDAVLWAYSQVQPPIAQLARVPFTNGNYRMVDPVSPDFVFPAAIYQNGGPYT